MTNAEMFFAGVGTTILLIGAGFSGGLLLAQTAMEPTAIASGRFAADRLPRARVVLPASAEPAAAPQPSANPTTPELEPARQPSRANEMQQSPERDKAAQPAERRKADEPERRKRVADRKARRNAARTAKLQEQQPAPDIVAFGRDDQHPPGGGGFFGN